jgi:hypothetical protein
MDGSKQKRRLELRGIENSFHKTGWGKASGILLWKRFSSAF